VNWIVKRSNWRRLALFVGLGITGIALLATVVVALERGRRDVRSLEAVIGERSTPAPSGGAAADIADGRRATRERLVEWVAVAGDDSRRLAALTGAARETGVSIVSMREGKVRGQAEVVLRSHLLQTVGTYPAQAAFLDSIAALEGLGAVETCTLNRDGDLDEGLLAASIEVAWYAPTHSADAAGGEE